MFLNNDPGACQMLAIIIKREFYSEMWILYLRSWSFIIHFYKAQNWEEYLI